MSCLLSEESYLHNYGKLDCYHQHTILTIANDQEEPPLSGELAEHQHQHEVEHDPLTQHPTKHRQEQIMKEGSNKDARCLQSCEKSMSKPLNTKLMVLLIL